MEKLSLRAKTAIWVAVIVLPLLILVVFFNVYTINRSMENIKESAQSVVALYGASMENELIGIESTILAYLTGNSLYYQLNYVMDEYELIGRLYDVKVKQQEIMSAYNVVVAMNIYSGNNDISRTIYRDGNGYDFKVDFDNAIIEMLNSDTNPSENGWHYIYIQEELLLLRVIGSKELFITVAVDPTMFAKPTQGGNLVYADIKTPIFEQNLELTQSELLLVENYESDNLFYTWQNYQVTKNVYEYSATIIYYIQDFDGVFGAFDTLQLLAACLSFVVISLIPLLISKFNKTSLVPMYKLLQTIVQIRSGNISAKMDTNYGTREFRQVSIAFNDMVSEIQQLKISAYEEKIAAQKAQLLLLQSQIRPHFYLNCLKNIQALAVQKNFDSIQSMVISLSVYLRHLFQKTNSMVTISAEKESICNYISLINSNSQQKIILNINIADDANLKLIPPLSILTFVENAINHARVVDKELCVTIKAFIIKVEECSFVNIQISDNGPGFSDEMLEQLNRKKLNLEGHNGILNVLERLKLSYDDSVSTLFKNDMRGACVELFLPVTSREER